MKLDKIKINLNYILYFILIFSLIFQDLPLALKYGEFLRNPTGILSLFIFLFVFLKNKCRINLKTRESQVVLYLIVIFTLFNIAFLFGCGFNYNLRNETMFSKTVKSSLYIYSLFAFLYDLIYFNKKITVKQRFKPFIVVFYINFIILLLELYNHHFFDALHCIIDYGTRIRLLCPEASNTGLLLLGSFLPTIYFQFKKKRQISMFLSIMMMVVQLYFSGSKSLLVCFLLVLMAIVIFMRKMNFILRLLVIVIFVLSIIFLKDTLIDQFTTDIENYTSVSTRLFTTIVAFIFAFRYPFGVGTAYYLESFPNMMLEYAPSFLEKTGFNGAEIYGIIYSNSDVAVSAKSGIGTLALYFGVIGLVLIMYILFRLIKRAMKQNDIFAFSILILTFIGLFTYGIDTNFMMMAVIFIGYENLIFNKANKKTANLKYYKMNNILIKSF